MFPALFPFDLFHGKRKEGEILEDGLSFSLVSDLGLLGINPGQGGLERRGCAAFQKGLEGPILLGDKGMDLLALREVLAWMS